MIKIKMEYLKNKNPIVLESNQNHATITQNGICTTLSAAMGLGGGYIPMIVVNNFEINYNNTK